MQLWSLLSLCSICLSGTELHFTNANVFIIFTTLPTDGEISGLMNFILQKKQCLLCSLFHSHFYVIDEFPPSGA